MKKLTFCSKFSSNDAKHKMNTFTKNRRRYVVVSDGKGPLTDRPSRFLVFSR